MPCQNTPFSILQWIFYMKFELSNPLIAPLPSFIDGLSIHHLLLVALHVASDIGLFNTILCIISPNYFLRHSIYF